MEEGGSRRTAAVGDDLVVWGERGAGGELAAVGWEGGEVSLGWVGWYGKRRGRRLEEFEPLPILLREHVGFLPREELKKGST